jgi:hypothetical protein
MKQGREARTCQETAERSRKPESGTAAGPDGPLHHGASPGDVVEGAKKGTSWEPDPVARPGSREDVKAL